MTENRVLIAEDIWGPAFDALAAEWPVHRDPALWQDPERLAAECARSAALVVRNRTSVDSSLLRSCPDLRVVARAGVGLDNIDLTAAEATATVVTVPLGANAVSVAEHALGLAIALARGTVRLDTETRNGSWNRTPGTELCGGVWGLLGAGATARACGRLAAALGMRVLAYDPYIDREHPGLRDITLAPLTEVAAESDVLSCHLPATGETSGLVDSGLLATMRPGALLINLGRGEVFDERALADALESGTIGGAALDVRATEPPSAGRLESAPNTILTPHIAGITA
ncbi:NAD(P)-dependent oxidoreductase, partial [Sciscionella sediminilitoris]|uniref:NAD(P)-dependent oxidoreductase n=1 Tax=Sciscionella sediminilitoris TaxID=1445613 RepID=UPI0004DF9182